MRRFNPVLGFLVVSTLAVPVKRKPHRAFQSRSGFSGRLDRVDSLSDRFRSGVSIPFWVFWSSRRPRAAPIPITRVSIPFWVFWSSRRCRHTNRGLRTAVFQSRSGFSGRLDITRADLTPAEAKFQSRSGFSGRLDNLICSVPLPGRVCFNPVLGFLVVSTSSRTARTGPSILFQSRSGFSGRLDDSEGNQRRCETSVSIPFWVFWSSRPLSPREFEQLITAFQSRSGFSGRLD